MRITKLILHRFERLHMLKEETFELDLEKDTLLLQGTNGAGKSSCLYELSPLPATMRHFKEGGYKTIHINHNKHQYILHSSGSGAGKHSFQMDGEELNDGGTLTVQYQLVEQHFNYTPKIHQLMIGKNNLTQMSGNERRDWFNQMSKIDNAFIDKLWDEIKSGQRDVQGAIKNTNQKIAEHTQSIATDETLKEYAQEQQELTGYQERLLEMRGKHQPKHPRQSIDKIEEEVSHYTQTYQQCTQQAQQLITITREGTVLGEVEDELNKAVQQRDYLQDQYNKTIDELSKAKQELHQYQFNDDIDPDELNRMKSSLEEKYNHLISKQPNIDAHYQKLKSQLSTNAIGNKLKEIIDLPDNFDKDIVMFMTHWLTHRPTEEEFDIDWVVQQRDEIGNRLQVLERACDMIRERRRTNEEHLEELKRSPEHECPSCHFRYKGKDVSERIEKITQQNQMFFEKLKKGTDEIMEKTPIYERHKGNVEAYQYVVREYFRDHRLSFFLKLYFRPYETEQDIKEIFKHHLPSYIESFQKIKRLCHVLYEYHQIMIEQEALEELEKKQLMSTSPVALGLQAQITILEKTLEESLSRLDAIDCVILYARSVINKKEVLDKNIDDNLARYNILVELFDDEVAHLRLETVSSMINVVVERLNEVNKLIQHQKGLEYLITHLNENKVQLEQEVEDHKNLMKILSPKDGLIAKTTVGFVRHFVKEMNHLIGHVWTYPLEITLDDEGLFTKDYKFPVKIGNTQSKLSPDVSETSTGQTEIINIAFRLTAMKYLGLTNYPLYADELGGSLIPQFRYNLYHLFSRMLEEQRFSSLFMISHLQDVHAILSAPQVIDLSR